MELVSETHDAVRVITVQAARIDAAVAIRFKEDMCGLINETQGNVILNLENVQFIDSSGLGAIVASMKLMPRDTKMALAGLSPTVDKVFRMTRMDSIFKVYATASDALDAGA